MFVADSYGICRHNSRMMDSRELLAELTRLKDDGVTTNADISRLLGLPTSRVAEIFSGKRKVTIDEMKALVDHYGLIGNAPGSTAENIDVILDEVLKLAPSGRMTAQSRRALSEAVAYGLGLLGETPSSRSSAHALEVAARAAAHRFRETGPSS